MLTFISEKQKKEILKLLISHYGIEDLEFPHKFPYILVKDTNGRIFIINEKIREISLSDLKIESIGLYFCKLVHNEIRLSMEGSFIIGKQAKKNILDISKEQLKDWISGKDIKLDENQLEESQNKDKNNNLQGFIIIKHNNDFLGAGKLKDSIILNFVPKERRSTKI